MISFTSFCSWRFLNCAASIAVGLLFICACSGEQDDDNHAGHDHATEQSTAPLVTNRIPVPESVRKNLG